MSGNGKVGLWIVYHTKLNRSTATEVTVKYSFKILFVSSEVVNFKVIHTSWLCNT